MILEVFSSLKDSMIWAPLRMLPAQPSSWAPAQVLIQAHLTAWPQAPQDKNVPAHPKPNEAGGEPSAILVEALVLLCSGCTLK